MRFLLFYIALLSPSRPSAATTTDTATTDTNTQPDFQPADDFSQRLSTQRRSSLLCLNYARRLFSRSTAN
jgi:hypothetical protein